MIVSKHDPLVTSQIEILQNALSRGDNDVQTIKQKLNDMDGKIEIRWWDESELKVSIHDFIPADD